MVNKTTRFSKWTSASSPNYEDNVDKKYPYSEVPYIGQYKLVKIPTDSNLIDLVDYWGEGKIAFDTEASGFRDCYNVNHPTQCVSNGPDKGRKVPNRIPVKSYTNCDTSSYIKDDSVKVVTINGAPINDSCATDIARIVNGNRGCVIVSGLDDSSEDITTLENRLKAKGLIKCDGYSLPENLRGSSLLDGHVLQKQLKEAIIGSHFENAVELSKSYALEGYGDTIRQVVMELLKESCNTIFSFAYKLWTNDGGRIIAKYFPNEFKLIFNEDDVIIVSKKYSLALKLAFASDRLDDSKAWADGKDKTSERVKWRFMAVWVNDKVSFRLLNVDRSRFLFLAAYTDRINDREAWGGYGFNETRRTWYLDPVIRDGELLFFIINCEYGLGLKLAVSGDSMGDHQLWGNNSDVHGDPFKYGWSIKSWK